MSFSAAERPLYSVEEARMLSGLQLAYVGDSVYDLLVRTYLMRSGCRVHEMHRMATERVNAVSQAKAAENVLQQLTEEETLIVKRGRNAHPHHSVPRAATAGDYALATGLEALLGFLYLTGQDERLYRIFALLEESRTCPEHT